MHLTTLHTPDALNARVSAGFVPPQLGAFDQWRVVRHLGSGATAHVWLMEHLADGSTVAAKTPRTEHDQHTLSQEAQLAAHLTHDNIVQLVDVGPPSGIGRDDRGVATFWEALPAGSLAALIGAAGPLSVAQTVTVVLPMVQATIYLHSQQIVHGDISPANILFDTSGRPVLTDFGAVRATAHAFTATGTPGFTAPEIDDPAGNLRGLGAAADCYALAAIAWFCLTGETPGPPEVRVPLMTLRPELDREIVEVLEAGLSGAPGLRPSLERMLFAVDSWAIPEPVDLYPVVDAELAMVLPTRKPRSQPRWGSRRERDSRVSQRVVLLAGLAALAVSAGLTWMATPHSTPLTSLPSHETTEVARTPDAQGIVDTLAKRRTEAWAQADPAAVGEYALVESEVFDADTAVLESLATTHDVLDGLRMRAVVDGVESTPQGIEASVQWRTDAYVQRDATGGVVQQVDSTTEHLVLGLESTAKGWRLGSVRAVEP